MTHQPPTESNLASRVLHRIQQDRIAVRSRWGVVVERLGLDGIGVVMVLVAIMAVSLLLFWARADGLFSYLQFGPVGVRAFFEAFPYQWLVIAALALLVIALLVRHVAQEVHLPFIPLAVAILLGVVGLGSVAAAAGMSDELAKSSVINHWVAPELSEHHGQSGVVGRVVGIAADSLRIVVGRETILVHVTNHTNLPLNQIVIPGDRIMVVSPAAQGGEIEAAGIRKLEPIYTNHMLAQPDIDTTFIEQRG